jgi:hypothetical protein
MKTLPHKGKGQAAVVWKINKAFMQFLQTT